MHSALGIRGFFRPEFIFWALLPLTTSGAGKDKDWHTLIPLGPQRLRIYASPSTAHEEGQAEYQQGRGAPLPLTPAGARSQGHGHRG
jgi:hypothetical protein